MIYKYIAVPLLSMVALFGFTLMLVALMFQDVALTLFALLLIGIVYTISEIGSRYFRNS